MGLTQVMTLAMYIDKKHYRGGGGVSGKWIRGAHRSFSVYGCEAFLSTKGHEDLL